MKNLNLKNNKKSMVNSKFPLKIIEILLSSKYITNHNNNNFNDKLF